MDVQEKPSTLTNRVLGSGDVLLSHDLTPDYHRGCSVSLPCSEWERVGPLRYCHQRSEPDWHLNRTGGFAAVAPTQMPTRISGGVGPIEVNRPYLNDKEQSTISWSADIYIQDVGDYAYHGLNPSILLRPQSIRTELSRAVLNPAPVPL